MMDADAIVYASPLFSWGFSTQMKTLIDRHMSIVTGFKSGNLVSKLEGKKTALMIICMGAIENNADLVQEVFQRLNQFTKCKIMGSYVVPFCPPPSGIGPTGEKTAEEIMIEIMNCGLSACRKNVLINGRFS